MVRLPGSGKTTLARKLEVEYAALRLTVDEWHVRLFAPEGASAAACRGLEYGVHSTKHLLRYDPAAKSAHQPELPKGDLVPFSGGEMSALAWVSKGNSRRHRPH